MRLTVLNSIWLQTKLVKQTRIDNIRMRTSDVKVKAGDNIDVKEVYDDANPS